MKFLVYSLKLFSKPCLNPSSYSLLLGRKSLFTLSVFSWGRTASVTISSRPSFPYISVFGDRHPTNVSQNSKTVNPNIIYFIFTRHKSQKSKKLKQEIEEDEENEWYEESVDVEGDSGKDHKDIVAHISSLRIDSVIKSGLGLSKNKIEDAFYNSLLRLNGEKVLKKSKQVELGDEIDVILGQNDKNPKFTDVQRVIILGIKTHPEKEKMIIKLRRFKRLTIEN